MQYLMTQY